MKKFSVYLFLLFAFSTNSFAAAALGFKKIIIPEAPPVASVMVAYMDITNNTQKTQQINSVSSPQFKRVEIHKMTMDNGMMNMQQLKTLAIKPGATVVLETGGLHIMLIKPLKPLKSGDKVELTFKLASGEVTIINTTVQKVDLTGSDAHKHHHH